MEPKGSGARLPLAGVRVCDLTWIVAGPTCTRILADFGAEVIRVEHGQRLDAMRMAGGRSAESPITANNSAIFNYINRNKKSVLLNVRHPFGMDLLRRLIAECDVLVENYSSGVMTSWGLDYPQLRELRPDIIYCSASGFGHTGRDRAYTTWGPTAQALSGLSLMSGLPGLPPAGWGFSYLDHHAGYFAATAVMMALHHRNRTGEGQQIDISQIECGLTLTGAAVLDYTVNGRSWRRPGMPPGNHAVEPRVAPHNTYRCQGDDRWVAIAVMNDAHWPALLRAMDEPEWAADPRFATNAGRLEHEDELDAQIGRWTAGRSDYQVMSILQAAGVPAGACQRASDKFERDPQLRERGWWHHLPHAELGDCVFDGVVPHLSRTPGEVAASSPLLGEHTAEVMREVVRLTPDEFAEYEELGVFM
jgi:crotonobetainyl-CoA:carnitine CoA-transferase CaiB-like acyl-CoA transferase